MQDVETIQPNVKCNYQNITDICINFYFPFFFFFQGYLDKFFPVFAKTQNESIADRIKEMQKFYHLTITGKLDRETEEIMKHPRCGLPDVAEYQLFSGAPKWKKTLLTYK